MTFLRLLVPRDPAARAARIVVYLGTLVAVGASASGAVAAVVNGVARNAVMLALVLIVARIVWIGGWTR